MKILIFGATGYLGRRLVEFFLESSFNVSYVRSRESERLGSLGCSWDRDLSGDYDLFLHLAGPNEVDVLSEGEETFKNIAKRVEICSRVNAKSLIFFSTFHVYSKKLSSVNEQSHVESDHPYGKYKILEEVLLLKMANLKKTTVIRLANTFGYPVDTGTNRMKLVVNDLCTQAIYKKELELKSSLTTKLNVLTISDLCKAVVHIKKNDLQGIYNICSGQLSLQEIVNLIQDNLSYSISVESPTVLESSSVAQMESAKLVDTGFNYSKNYSEEILKTLDIIKESKGE